jgi:CHAT domain-containing protein
MQTTALDLEDEIRAIELELQAVKYRDQVVMKPCHAVRPDDLVRYVREYSPNVIHFSGHGSGAGIVLRSDDGGFQSVDGAALRRFFNDRGVELVVLNACASGDQAKDISSVVPAVVGTSENVGDEAARRFSVAFYRGLGNGLKISEAFRDGGDSVALHGLDDVFVNFGDLETMMTGFECGQ